MRAMWKARIELGDETVPVKLYAAVEDKTVHFRLLHEKDLAPVQQKMIHPGTDEEVPSSEIRKGYEVDKGVFVAFDEAELESIEPESSRDIEIVRFVDPQLIDHRWYERPYFLGPDGGDESYAALRDALAREGKEGVARWTMRNRSYVGALRAHEDGLILISLRNASEVVSAEELPRPAGRDLDKRERDMARKLVEALSDDFDPSEWKDEYRERVMEMIETKAEGGEVKLRKFRPRKTDDGALGKALEASLKELGRKGA